MIHTCFIQILQCKATDSPILATTKLLFREKSSNLGSTTEPAEADPAGDLLTMSEEDDDEEETDVLDSAEILGPIIGSVKPKIFHKYQLISSKYGYCR